MTLSSAEAELGGVCKGSGISLGLVAVGKDPGLNWKLTIETDASAAAGICRRRGLGTIRRLATSDLWVQDRIRTGDFSLRNMCGSDNTSDILTKYVERPLLKRHLAARGLRAKSGRPETAPNL